MGEKTPQNSASAVPKFASFKSKPAPAASPSIKSAKLTGAESSRDPSGRGQEKKAAAYRYIQTVGQEYGTGKSQDLQSESRRALEIPHLARGRPKDQLKENISDVFRTDRAGDPKNLTYGSLHRSMIPRYSRSGYGYLLGNLDAQIDRRKSNEKELLLSIRSREPREKWGQDTLAHAVHLKPRRLKVLPDQAEKTAFATAAAYIPLRPPGANLGKQEVAESHARLALIDRNSEGDDSDEPANSSDDLASASEYEERHATSESTLRKKAELQKRVQSDPSNCDAWLELVDYQDLMIGNDRQPRVRSVTCAERQSNAEVKVSIYESALKSSLSTESREKLILGMMEEGSKVWGSEALLSKWQHVLRMIPASFKLWTRYLDFRQCSFSRFRYEEIRSSFIGCLALLRNAHADPKTSSTERGSIYNVAVYVILRLTSLTREAGHPERAVATWQALLEYVTFRPSRFLGPHTSVADGGKTMLSSFEKFWESEVPRIGEDGAKGWARFDVEHGEPPHSTREAEATCRSDTEVFGEWAVRERRKALGSRRPARTIDDVEENDPYRVILFSDIQDVLEHLPASPVNHSLLITGWLAFCHLPPWTKDGGNLSVSRNWYRDPLSQMQPLAQSNNDYSTLESPDQSTRTFKVFPIDHEVSIETLFSSKNEWFSAFDASIRGYVDDHGPIEISLLRKTLGSLVERDLEDDSIAEYFLALELQLSPSTARRISKSLLKNRPQSLRLYNAYACIEYRTGNESRAQNVIITAINNSRSLPDSSQDDAIFLWRTWVWELFSSGKSKAALERLISCSDPHPPSDCSAHRQDVTDDFLVRPAALLRAQQALAASRDHFISLARPVHSFIACDLLILLSYLSTSASLPSATITFESNFSALGSRFPSTSSAYELLHQSLARLLYNHATHTPLCKPSIIRERLAASIALFPHNTILLSVYAWNETRFRIDDRVRTIFNDVVLQSTISDRRLEERDNVIPHFFTLHSELDRSLIAGSNTNTIRNTFERAVHEDAAGAHCIGLWKSYILFELSRGEGRRARTVWWRGVQACPWAKELWMIAFQELRSEMMDEELKGLYEMMVEKELRMHVDLLEMLEDEA